MTEVRHAILQVISGPEAFRKAVLAPGDVIRVGRGEGSDVVLPQDAGLGRIQFEIDWDGSYCELRARLSAIGPTLLDGLPAAQARAKHGAWIHAGSTDFMVYHEAHTPPRAPPKSDPAHVEKVTKALAALSAETSLYGVFDAARDERVLVLLREAVEEHRSLYEGPKGLAMADVAPYLVRFQPGSRLLRALVEEGWGEAWGVYFTSAAPPKAARRHLRRFLMVAEDKTGERLYFRWYDPRVLRDFLPIATVRQESELFDDVREWIFEGEDLEVVRAQAPAEVRARASEGGEVDVPSA